MLAVDLGCGTGQNSRLFAPNFQEVVGIDISEGQLEEARAIPGHSNITYRCVSYIYRNIFVCLLSGWGLDSNIERPLVWISLA